MNHHADHLDSTYFSFIWILQAIKSLLSATTENVMSRLDETNFTYSNQVCHSLWINFPVSLMVTGSLWPAVSPTTALEGEKTLESTRTINRLLIDGEDPDTMLILRVVHVRYHPMVIVWWTRRHSMESSLVDRAYTNLSGDIQDAQDSTASDDIHLRTCRETFLVAREKRDGARDGWINE